MAVRLQEFGVLFGRVRSVLYEDIYLDTADFRLWRSGAGLRVRHVNGRTVATLKTGRVASNIAERIERSEPVQNWRDSSVPVQVPGTALRRVLCEAGLPTRVRPIARLTVRRTMWATRWPTGWTAKVCADRVQAIIARRRVAFAELEIESNVGQTEMSRAIAAVRAWTPWPLVHLSKLERACQLAGRPLPQPPPKGPGTLHRNTATTDAARQILQAYWAQYLWNLSGAIAGFDPEFLHDLRVAIRRMRATASALETALPPAVTQWIRDLRPIAQAAGAVRDLDIMMAWAREPPSRDMPTLQGAYRTIMGVLSRERSRRLHLLRQILTSPAHDRLRRFARRWFREHAEPESNITAYDVILRGTREAWKAARSAGRAVDRDAPLKRFHELRISCKILRYRLELLGCFADVRVRKAIARLAKLQDKLGRLQDLATVRSELTALYQQSDSDTVSQLLDRWRAYLDLQIEASRRAAWKSIDTLKWRRLTV